jgi:uncharacterized membrane protein YeaQ/YmgE (transglycosylase-associated protein family)
MTWTLTSLVIQIIAGLIRGHVTAVAAHEHAFGTVGHTVTGLVGGFLSGYFLQTLVITGTGSLTEPRLPRSSRCKRSPASHPVRS